MKKHSKKSTLTIERQPATRKPAVAKAQAATPVEPPASRIWWVVVGGTLAAVAVWSYWPTLCDLVKTWSTQPDYSHGFFVVPLAGYFLWARRQDRPAVAGASSAIGSRLLGLAVVGLALAVRWYGAYYTFDPLEGWSLVIWLTGVCWMLTGGHFLRWCLPSLIFLFFMLPLPYRIETALGIPLQKVATRASCWLLQSLGQPALFEGNVILLGDERLEVSQACSGLRMFMGITALAFVYIVLTKRAWWEKGLLALGVVPIALLANILRITVTALLYPHFPEAGAKKIIHDGAGLFTILLAAAMFGIALWYLRRLVREVQVLDRRELVRPSGGA